VANRSQAETENLVGFFANTLVLRTRLDSDTDFNALLRQVRTTALDAFAHQELPFEKLVEALQPERSMDRSPLFQAMLVLQNTPGAAFALPGLEWRAIDSDSRTAKFDITLAVAGDGDVLEAGLEYNTALFDHDTIARMAGHLLRLIDAACADPALPLAELSMLAPEEQQQILYGFNPGHSSPAGTIQAMFEAAAGRTPGAIAVEYEDQILSCRTQCARQSAGTCCYDGCAYRRQGRRVPRTFARHGHCIAGRAKSRCGLCAARSWLSARPPVRHAGGRCANPGANADLTDRSPACHQ
jgi:non-ribosomal peptide synthetase component F